MGGRALLADEPGCGKTVQVMAYAHKNSMFPMLVACPNSLKYMWRNEIIAMTGNTYKINIVGTAISAKQAAIRAAKNPNVIYSKKPVNGCDIYIINYEILSSNVIEIESLSIKYLVADESHKCKNPDATRTHAFQRLALGYVDVKKNKGKRQRIKYSKGIDSITMVSGTPMINRPKEIWTTVSTIAPWVPQWKYWNNFGFQFCGAKKNKFGWDFNGASNLPELNKLLLEHVMSRRLKEDVLTELPSKNIKMVPLEFDRRDYDKVANSFSGIDWKGGIETIITMGGNPPKSDDAIVAIQKLREIAGLAKLKSAIEWIKDFTENGEKLVVFAHHRDIINAVKNELEQDDEYRGKIGVIYGGITPEERDTAVQNFQKDDSNRIILVSIDAGGVGLTLTAASNSAFIQLPWSPANLSQAIDRVHRIGQRANQVNVWILTAEGTIEEDIAEMILHKGKILDEAIDSGRVVNLLEMTK